MNRAYLIFTFVQALCFLNPTAFARMPLIETKEADGYKIEKRTNWAVLGDDLKTWNPTTITYSLIGPEGKKIMDLDDVNFREYRPLEKCKDELLWVTYKPTKENPHSGPETVHTYDIKTKARGTLDKVLWPPILSPNCKQLVYREGQNLALFDRNKKTSVVFTKLGDGGRDDGFTPLYWSSDGSKFWYGSGVTETYSKLGYYQDGKTTWLPFDATQEDSALEPDRAWFAHSDAPMFFDSTDQEEYEKSDKITFLKVTDLVTGKEIVIDKAKTNKFSPTWTRETKLEYKLRGKTKSIDYKDLEKKLQSGKVSEAYLKKESK